MIWSFEFLFYSVNRKFVHPVEKCIFVWCGIAVSFRLNNELISSFRINVLNYENTYLLGLNAKHLPSLSPPHTWLTSAVKLAPRSPRGPQIPSPRADLRKREDLILGPRLPARVPRPPPAFPARALSLSLVVLRYRLVDFNSHDWRVIRDDVLLVVPPWQALTRGPPRPWLGPVFVRCDPFNVRFHFLRGLL